MYPEFVRTPRQRQLYDTEEAYRNLWDAENRPTMSNTGDHLHAIIRTYTKQDFTPTCSCRAMVEKMNSNPPEWSLENMKEILGVLRAEAKQRSWWTHIAVSLPGHKAPIRWMIREAVSRAQADARTPETALDGG